MRGEGEGMREVSSLATGLIARFRELSKTALRGARHLGDERLREVDG